MGMVLGLGCVAIVKLLTVTKAADKGAALMCQAPNAWHRLTGYVTLAVPADTSGSLSQRVEVVALLQSHIAVAGCERSLAYQNSNKTC
jgi:hypothetical protein